MFTIAFRFLIGSIWFACLFFSLFQISFASTLFSSDFESGNIGSWLSSGGGATATISADLAKSGLYSIKVSHDKVSSYGFQTVVSNIEGGMFYEGSGYGKTTDSNTASFFVRVAWYSSADGSGSQLSSPNDSNVGSISDSNWQLLTTNSIQSPANANSAKVRLVLTSKTSGLTASAYFDDILFKESIAPTSIPTNTPTPTPTPTPRPTVTLTSVPTLALTSVGTLTITPVLSLAEEDSEESKLDIVLGKSTEEASLLEKDLKKESSPTGKISKSVKNLETSQNNLPIILFLTGGIFLIACGILVFRIYKNSKNNEIYER